MKIETILFDMDGIVIDSERLHLEAMELALQTFDIEISQEELIEFVGRSDESFFHYIYDEVDNQNSFEDMLNEKNRQYEILINNIQYINGFEEFILQVKERKIKTALVTSSTEYTVNKTDKLLNHAQFFDSIVFEEKTTRHKPNPDPYLLGLAETNSIGNSSLVIEDSINGIISGKAAGCIVAGLTTSFSKDRLLDAGADYVFDSYEELAQYLF